ncbi:NIPSNAP family protein [Oceanicola sp. 502str15]|uniref:NIPSNAP family protein n=1 Tax=Oceanicola sp. 502str15 TaxID=2696061 RepID=UPI002094FECD|nr:NIPSNAP family protein [Oceanicola sp. 502str15]
MLFELRIYEAMPGRLGDVLARFRDHTVPIWESMGIEPVGFWTTQIGASTNNLYYMLRWESLAAREQLWATFAKSPEYAEAKAASEANGPIVASVSNQILSPTAFSKLK